MSNLAQYGDWTLDQAQEDADELERSSSSGDWLKLKEGQNVLRFLPPIPGGKPFVLVHQHYLKTGGSDKPVVFACPRRHAKRRCPACEMAERLRDSPSGADQDRGREMGAKLRVFALVVDRHAPEAGVQTLGFGKQIWEQLLSIRRNEDAGGNFTDPSASGFDVVIERKGKGLNTEYKVFPARKSSPLGNDEWLGQLRALSVHLQVPSEAELADKLAATTAGGGGRVEQPRGRRGRPASVADDIDTVE